jgi:C4-dicarboxylate-specific signal transduction histidine kinase
MPALKNSSTPTDRSLAALLHELNQPLTAILSNARAAQRFLLNPTLDRHAEMHDILEDIVADDKKAAGIVEKLRRAIKDAQGGDDEPAAGNRFHCG